MEEGAALTWKEANNGRSSKRINDATIAGSVIFTMRIEPVTKSKLDAKLLKSTCGEMDCTRRLEYGDAFWRYGWWE